VPEESLEIVINARDYASETLRGITGSVRSLGMSTVMLASNIAYLTRELGLNIPALNEIVRVFHVIGVAIRAAGAAMNVYQTLTRGATLATVAQTLAQHGLNTALAITVGLLTAGIGLMGAILGYGALRAAVPSMQLGGLVPREGVYYLHAGEAVVPRSTVTSTSYGPTVINIYFENRAPISSEVDAQSLLRDLGQVVADKARRGGYR